MGIFQYLRRLMGLETVVAEKADETATETVVELAKEPKAATPAKKPGRPAKAYQKKAKPIGGKKL